MNNRKSPWDDYGEMMSLVPNGNRQIVVAIGRGLRTLTLGLVRRVCDAMQHMPDGPTLP